tara:strand:+ start:1934 stop:2065 length:132 start_codon:yes stop_codon:yes gene_type:complete
MSFWLREKEKSAFFGQTRREKEKFLERFWCVFLFEEIECAHDE